MTQLRIKAEELASAKLIASYVKDLGCKELLSQIMHQALRDGLRHRETQLHKLTKGMR